ncbi:hypothetical protein CAEBREN_25797 [Caenorhabditis brenneri]|uniref:Uncharacterized protein n=1 Tax=Caenorhabditis brenneri TaxID=135651 RepID=G0N4H1_CAEBE|nr:hypothetical protein CAEBREN_25797 [Caenorhabditis brenneri]
MDTNAHSFLRRTFSSYGTTARHVHPNNGEDKWSLVLKAFCVIIGVAVLVGLICLVGMVVRLYVAEPDLSDSESYKFFLKHVAFQNNPDSFR